MSIEKSWAVTMTCNKQQRSDYSDRSQFIFACVKLHDIYAGKPFHFIAEYHHDGVLHFHGQVPRVGQLIAKMRRIFGHVKVKRLYSAGWGVYCAKELYETERKLCYKPMFSNLTRDSDLSKYFPIYYNMIGRGVTASPGVKAKPEHCKERASATPFGDPVPIATETKSPPPSPDSWQEGFENHYANYKMKDY